MFGVECCRQVGRARWLQLAVTLRHLNGRDTVTYSTPSTHSFQPHTRPPYPILRLPISDRWDDGLAVITSDDSECLKSVTDHARHDHRVLDRVGDAHSFDGRRQCDHRAVDVIIDGRRRTRFALHLGLQAERLGAEDDWRFGQCVEHEALIRRFERARHAQRFEKNRSTAENLVGLVERLRVGMQPIDESFNVDRVATVRVERQRVEVDRVFDA